jgi:hypothetical protein
VNKTASDQWEYIRDVGNGFLGHRDDPQYPDIVPTKNFTCGVDAWKANRNQTLTADVVAGSEIGIRMTPYQVSDCSRALAASACYVNIDWDIHRRTGSSTSAPRRSILLKRRATLTTCLPGTLLTPIGKSGPCITRVHKSKALTRVYLHRFKIATAGAVDDTHWYLTGFKRKDWNFTIPASTPPGKYMLRHEQIWPQELPTPTSGPGGINVRVSDSLLIRTRPVKGARDDEEPSLTSHRSRGPNST